MTSKFRQSVYPRPNDADVDKAIFEIPSAFQNAIPGPGGKLQIVAVDLCFKLIEKGHTRAAAEHAIIEAADKGLIEIAKWATWVPINLRKPAPAPTFSIPPVQSGAMLTPTDALWRLCSRKSGGGNMEANHAVDFRSVDWFGTKHCFTANQAACIKVLWEHWKRGTPEVGGHAILETADVSQTRLDMVFRDHSAWGTMIVSKTRGSYCLKEPAATKPEKKTRRAAKTRS